MSTTAAIKTADHSNYTIESSSVFDSSKGEEPGDYTFFSGISRNQTLPVQKTLFGKSPNMATGVAKTYQSPPPLTREQMKIRDKIKKHSLSPDSTKRRTNFTRRLDFLVGAYKTIKEE